MAAQVVTLERTSSSLTDSDYSTRQTIELMVRHIKDALRDPKLRQVGHDVRARWALGSQDVATAWAIYWFEKHELKFKSDEAAIFDRFRERDQVDFLIAPSVLIRSRRMEGDCDEFAMLACALLLANGIDCEIVTLACDRSRPEEWSHVYVRAILKDGQRMAIDATPASQYPGWEVPAYDVQRKQVWNMRGQPVADSAPHRSRLHAYVPMRRRRRGVGQDQADVSGYTGWVSGASDAGSSFNWNNLVNQLVNVGSRLGTIALTPRGGYVAQPGMVSSNVGIPYAAAGSGNLLFWGVVGLAGFAVLMAIGRGSK